MKYVRTSALPSFTTLLPSCCLWGWVLPLLWFTSSEDVTLSPFYSYWAFLERECKEACRSRSGKLPGFPSTTQKTFKSLINGMAQGHAGGWFWRSWPTWVCRPLLSHWSRSTAQGLPWYAYMTFWLHEEQSQKASKKCQTGKKKLTFPFPPFHWGAQPVLMVLSLHGDMFFAMLSSS